MLYRQDKLFAPAVELDSHVKSLTATDVHSRIYTAPSNGLARQRDSSVIIPVFYFPLQLPPFRRSSQLLLRVPEVHCLRKAGVQLHFSDTDEALFPDSFLGKLNDCHPYSRGRMLLNRSLYTFTSLSRLCWSLKIQSLNATFIASCFCDTSMVSFLLRTRFSSPFSFTLYFISLEPIEAAHPA